MNTFVTLAFVIITFVIVTSVTITIIVIYCSYIPHQAPPEASFEVERAVALRAEELDLRATQFGGYDLM